MVKNISLSDAAYELLAGVKTATESFSDVITKLLSRKKDITRFFGLWSADNEIGKIFEDILKNRHELKTRRV